jgi:hypothetical protein
MQNIYSFSIYMPVSILNGISTCLTKGILYDKKEKYILSHCSTTSTEIKEERMIFSYYFEAD